MQIIWLLIDVVIGVVLAGLAAPFALTALPERTAGPALLATVVVVCIVLVSLLRHAFVGTPGARTRR